MRRLAIIAAVGVLAAGCGSSGTAPPTPARPAPAPVYTPPPIAIAPAPISVPPPPSAPPDQCGAWELQHVVGRPRSEIPVPVDVTRRRVVCTTCPRTMDFNERRMTIEYDADTNRVTKVSCG